MSSAHLVKFNSVKPAEIEWRDGLPYSLEFDDVYFSKYGAVEESTHVFITGNQLVKDWTQRQQQSFVITELGFGSGLNFLNTSQHWLATNKEKNRTLHYVSIEKRPFSLSDLKQTLKHWPQFKTVADSLIENYPSPTYGRHQLNFNNEKIVLTLLFMPVEDALNDLVSEFTSRSPQLKVDHWFLDGFSPANNEEMWAKDVTQKMATISKANTRLATYSVAGIVKKPLREAGFRISKRKGFAKKREMLTATFDPEERQVYRPKFVNFKYDKPWFNFENQLTIEENSSARVAIIGGGIAGCSLAYCLSQKNISFDLYDRNASFASEASGAAAGIFHPQLTGDLNIGSQFNWRAYLTLVNFLNELPRKVVDNIFIQRGLERFLKDKQSTQQLLLICEQYHLKPWISKSKTYNNNDRCVQFKDAGVINIPALCEQYLELAASKNSSTFTSETVLDISRNETEVDPSWKVTTNRFEENYQQVVYCGGANSQILEKFNALPTNITRGQTCYLRNPELAKQLHRPISEQVYLVASDKNDLHIGTTFDSFKDDQLSQASQDDILERTNTFLKEINLPSIDLSDDFPLQGTIGYRLHSMDRLPIVGPAFDQQKLSDDFSHFGQRKLIRDSIGQYNHNGLWLNTAYGSHGLLYSLIASHHLVSLINNEISPLQKNLSDAINPARFFVKTLK